MNDSCGVIAERDYIGVMDGGDDTVSVSGTDDGDETRAVGREDATELIETGTAPTPDLAWSVSDDDELEVEHRGGGRTRWLAASAALLVAVAAVGVSVFFWRQDRAQPPQPAPAPSAVPAQSAPPQPSIAAPPAAPPSAPAVVAIPAPPPPDKDTQYFATLAAHGMTSSDPQNSLRAAHQVCALFDQGYSRSEVVAAVLNGSRHNENANWAAEAEYVDIATSIYCPQGN